MGNMSTPEVLPNSIAESMQHTGESALHGFSNVLHSAADYIDSHAPEAIVDDGHSSSYAALSAAGDSSVEGAVTVNDIITETTSEAANTAVEIDEPVPPTVFAVQEDPAALEEASFYMD